MKETARDAEDPPTASRHVCATARGASQGQTRVLAVPEGQRTCKTQRAEAWGLCVFGETGGGERDRKGQSKM